MAFTNPAAPNLADFATFVYDQGITAEQLPVGSDYLIWSFDIAKAKTLVPPPGMPPILYVLALYNLGMHTLIGIAQDQTGQTTFSDARKGYGYLSFSAGPVTSTSDNGSGTSLLAPDFLKKLTLQDILLLKTPWGRQYLAYAQQYGPNVVGVS